VTDWKYLLDLCLKALPALAALVFLALSQQFVTRGEYLATSDKFSGRLEAVEKLLIQMTEQNKQNDRQDREILDHEARIRALEAHHQ
jgi:hypothetical protein